MHKYVPALILLLISFLLFPAAAKADTITKLNDLIENAKELDGKELIIQGEAIGESMDRGDYTWVNINDGTNAIGIWMSKEDADKIKHYGNYKNIGDMVQVTGVYHRACKEHGGEADFHADSTKINESGYAVDRPVSVPRISAAVALTGLSLLLFRYYYKLKNRRAM